jgi:crotonobetainyl-CoA:carnitine CoA-transferase CaiB-like acyl-CoA transferase
MPAAFEGVKILELATGIAGPYMSMMLCDLGADVTKVEPLEGDPYRGQPGFLVMNRGKKSLKLDFRKRSARTIVNKLIGQADILIVDIESDQTKSLGINYDTLHVKYPRLIFCSISGWGESGPMAGRPATPNLIAAYNGVIASQASFTPSPMYIVMPLAALSAAEGGAISLIAALFYRARTGRGQKVYASLFGVAGTWGEKMTQAIRDLTSPYGHAPTYRIYQAKDGWIQIAAGGPAFCGKLFIAMGKELLISDPKFANLPWGVLNRDHRKELENIIAEWVRQYTRDEVLKILEENDVPCGAVRSVEEFARHPQVVYANKVIELDDPNVGRVKQMGPLIEMALTPPRVCGPSPRLGQDTDRVLRGIGYSATEIAKLRGSSVI